MNACLITPLARRGPWRTPENGLGAWPLALGGDLFPYDADDLAPLEQYDVLLLHVAMAVYDRAGEILGRFAHKTTVCMLTCDAMFIDPQGFFPGWRTPLKALLDRADLVASETEEVGFFGAMTTTPVVHLPLPVPVAAIRAVAADSRAAASERNDAVAAMAPHAIWLGAAFRPKKNGIATAHAFKRLRELFGSCAEGSPGRQGQRPSSGSRVTRYASRIPRHVSRIEHEARGRARFGDDASRTEAAAARTEPRPPRTQPTRSALPQAIVFADEPEAEQEAYAQWGIDGVDVLPTCPQPELWRRVAGCRLALHLDYRRTIGRFSADCAALGIPCISTASVTMQRALFPDLIVEPWDVDGAALLAVRLLREPFFADHIIRRAADAIAEYDLAPMARRFRRILDRVTRGT